MVAASLAFHRPAACLSARRRPRRGVAVAPRLLGGAFLARPNRPVAARAHAHTVAQHEPGTRARKAELPEPCAAAFRADNALRLRLNPADAASLQPDLLGLAGPMVSNLFAGRAVPPARLGFHGSARSEAAAAAE